MKDVPKNFVAEPFEYAQIIELDIVDINNLGHGVGRIDNWVVIVPLALAGERVRARVYKNHKNYSEADLVEVLKASENRVEAPCKIFEKCGGCQYQHLKYEAQLLWKQKQIKALLKHNANIDFDVDETFASPKLFGYRSKLTPHYEKPRNGKMPIGFIQRGRRRNLVDVEECVIASEAINQALPVARQNIIEKSHKLKKGGTLLLRDSLEGVCSDNNETLSERIGNITYQFIAGEFFQNNPYILPHLIDYAIEQALPSRYLVDAYCGVGAFALAAAHKFEKTMGVEISSKAIICANANAKINNINNCEFRIGKAEAIFADIKDVFENDETSMIIDPPRSGCDKLFLNQLIEYSPKRLVYVSCGPDTQARDLEFLIANGYKLLKVKPFDLFPQTRHIESVATLVKL